MKWKQKKEVIDLWRFERNSEMKYTIGRTDMMTRQIRGLKTEQRMANKKKKKKKTGGEDITWQS